MRSHREGKEGEGRGGDPSSPEQAACLLAAASALPAAAAAAAALPRRTTLGHARLADPTSPAACRRPAEPRRRAAPPGRSGAHELNVNSKGFSCVPAMSNTLQNSGRRIEGEILRKFEGLWNQSNRRNFPFPANGRWNGDADGSSKE